MGSTVEAPVTPYDRVARFMRVRAVSRVEHTMPVEGEVAALHGAYGTTVPLLATDVSALLSELEDARTALTNARHEIASLKGLRAFHPGGPVPLPAP